MPLSHLAIEVFCSYAQKDERYLRQLETHLSTLNRQGLISLRHDRQILPGADWANAIDKHLETASIILLLISADFIASDYCSGIEMKRALERHKTGEARVIPIVVRPCEWQQLPIGKLQALPMGTKPISKWKPIDQGWTQVAAGLRRVIEDLSLLSAGLPRSSLPTIWMIPYPRNPFFQGHDALLLRIHTQLWAEQAAANSQPQAISGLGGIGKTQIAVEYAYRYYREYQMVLWARAESIDSLNSSYVQIATQLNLPEKDAKDQKIVIEAVKTWLHDHTKWLLILDNADNLDILSPFLAPIPSGHVLLTTRAWDMQRLATCLEVKTLSDEQGAVLLLQRAGLLPPGVGFSEVSSDESEWAIQLAQQLGGLPLALDQAGAYLEATGTSLAEYYQIYLKNRQELLKQRRSRIPDHPDSVATTWSLSFQQVEENNAAAADLLRLCAYLASDVIPEKIITQGARYLGPLLKPVAADAFLLAQVVEALRAYSLVNRNPRTQTLSIHRLVQAVLHDSMPAKIGRRWKQRAMRAVNAASPNVQDIKQWEFCEHWLPHAQVCAGWIETEPEAANLLNVAGNYLYARARYQEAEELYKRALTIREQQLGPTHPNTATSLNNLAVLYQAQGKYVEAEELWKRALEIREQQLGPTHPDTAQSLNNLANLYYQQEKYEEAELLYKRALSIREQQLGAKHPDVAQSLNNLANLYYQQERYMGAELLYKRALSIHEQQLGPVHPSTATSLNNLAGLYESQGKYVEAEELWKRALEIREQQLGPTHPDTAQSLNNLANLYYQQERYTEAEPLYKRASAIREQQLGSAHPSTATSLNNLASLYASQEKYTEAEPLYKRALEIRERQLGATHALTAQSFNNLANLHRAQGKYEEFEMLYALGLATREQRSRAARSSADTSLDNLAGLYDNQGKSWVVELVHGQLLPLLLSREQQLEATLRDLISLLKDISHREKWPSGRVEGLYERIFSLMELQLETDHLSDQEIKNLMAIMRGPLPIRFYLLSPPDPGNSPNLKVRWRCEHILFGMWYMAKIRHNDQDIRYQKIRDILKGFYFDNDWEGNVEVRAEYERMLSFIEQQLETNHLDSMAIFHILVPLSVLVLSTYFWEIAFAELIPFWEEGHSSFRAGSLYERMFFLMGENYESWCRQFKEQ